MSSRVNCSKKCLHLNKKYANICFVERFVQQSISRRVGMADDADSKSVGCTPVRVQVPPPAVMKRQDICPVFLYVKKNPARRIPRLRRVASATYFLTAAVRSSRSVLCDRNFLSHKKSRHYVCSFGQLCIFRLLSYFYNSYRDIHTHDILCSR